MKYGNLNLFPLVMLTPAYVGYLMDKDGDVYSLKQSPIPKKMYGSGIGTSKTYTLNKVSVNASNLKMRAKMHKEFYTETGVITVKQAEVKPNRSHAPRVSDGIQARGVVIAQVATHNGVEHLLFGSKPAIHMTEASYKNEMQRLAMSKPGTKFVALKIVSSVVSGGMEWD